MTLAIALVVAYFAGSLVTLAVIFIGLGLSQHDEIHDHTRNQPTETT